MPVAMPGDLIDEIDFAGGGGAKITNAAVAVSRFFVFLVVWENIRREEAKDNNCFNQFFIDLQCHRFFSNQTFSLTLLPSRVSSGAPKNPLQPWRCTRRRTRGSAAARRSPSTPRSRRARKALAAAKKTYSYYHLLSS